MAVELEAELCGLRLLRSLSDGHEVVHLIEGELDVVTAPRLDGLLTG